MEIDLTKIPIMYLNLDEDVEKRVNLEKELKSVGLTKNLIRFSAHKGAEIVDYKSLRKAIRVGTYTSRPKMKEELGKDKLPFLILEDDLIINNFVKSIEVPDDADAIYLALYKTAITEWHPEAPLNLETAKKSMIEGNFKYKKINDQISRLGCMYGGAAILYISKRYYDHSMWAYDRAKELDIDYDKITSITMPFYNVYALNNPLFIARSQPNVINYRIKQK